MTDTITLPRSVVEQALKALEKSDRISGYRNNRAAVNSLIAALEQPQVEQEPVAWANPRILEWSKRETEKVEKLTRKAQPAYDFTVPLYTHLQPPRQPLSDEQIDKLDWGPRPDEPMSFKEALREFARAIEAAHGIKEQK